MPRKTLVFTSANAEAAPMLVEWLVSLRSVANYDGEVLILDYGLEGVAETLLQSVGAKRFQVAAHGPIVTARFRDAAALLAAHYPDHLVAHFDADIWFQDEIDSLFQIAERRQGVVFSPDVCWYREPYRGLTPSQQPSYEAKLDALIAEHGGTVQGGMQCAHSRILTEKYLELGALIASGFVKNEYGADQFAFNYLYDARVDTLEGHLYNCIGVDGVLRNGTWYSRKYSSRGEPKAKALHCVGMVRRELERRFFYVQASALESALAPHDVRPFNPDVKLTHWEIADTSSVWARLCGIVQTCRRHRRRAISVGNVQSGYLLADIGCTGLVPLQHGHDHYWDRIHLPRQQHIAHPEHLALSERAVCVLAELNYEELERFCAQFEAQYVDLMLSMLCREQGLSYGLMLPAAKPDTETAGRAA